jgi:ubiquinone/menaquinone biosynthesis C-methylase UbiE
VISFRDFDALPPRYLRNHFLAEAHGFTLGEIACAVDAAEPTLRSRFLRNVPRLRTALAERAASRSAARIQADLVAHYLWEIVYWKFPDLYEQLSQAEHLPMEDYFPSSVLRDRNILEIGCGSGKATQHLAIYARKLTAIDPSTPLLAIARRKLRKLRGVTLARGSFGEIDATSACFDIIASCLAYQANEERGGERGLAEMRRVLRPGGTISLVVGSAATGEFLLARGFTSRKVASLPSLRLAKAAKSHPLLTVLAESARSAFEGSEAAVSRVYEWTSQQA